MKIYTKEELIKRLKEIRDMGWVKCTRPANDGCVGNTLEDLLGIAENNIPLANSGEWEIKAQRATSSSLTTLLHLEPSPQAIRFVPNIFLSKYGWPHETIPNELSFRQTIRATHRTDRGFTIIVNDEKKRIEVSFDANTVDARHNEWLKSVEKRAGLGELNPQPYWGFDDLYHKIGSKLLNCVYVRADALKGDPLAQTRIDGRSSKVEYYKFNKIFMLSGLDQEKIISAIKNGKIYVDFDARTHHNHGTKFRMAQDTLPELYKDIIII
ncbi:hypothetical protein Mtc_2389 [Methanocella conradii HZ254]|uniref:MvaI/BcnI restriction endonuclease domain-containing protein n=1 Tax=Methanocella conradii (strain DSM 24694 / JCM 17849 / CGMCC 1.5162 / HZ254) TaxID=1041930 RepID=H8I6C2_METCZ|nr:MvaI/BcnI family restriction endonuclease [Methanocella conradii]AFD01120.1 hypothetical protein Mtc_2389 [Methanocella conradii HZ254]